MFKAHVIDQLRYSARYGVPRGEYRVDASQLAQARQGVPRGEYHFGGSQLA